MQTIAQLIEFYKGSEEFSQLAPNSQKHYAQMLSKPAKYAAGKIADYDSYAKVNKLKKEWSKVYSKTVVAALLRVNKRMWQVNVLYGNVPTNPFNGVTAPTVEHRHTLWTREQIEFVKNEAVSMGFPSFATFIQLCYETCQRPIDIMNLTYSNINNGKVTLFQEKTKAFCSIPLSGTSTQLLSVPSTQLEGEPILIYELTGEPYTHANYQYVFDMIKANHPHLRHLQIRDLRRTGLTELGEAGCTEDEIRSVSGHKSREMVSIYVIPTDKTVQSAFSKRNNLFESTI